MSWWAAAAVVAVLWAVALAGIGLWENWATARTVVEQHGRAGTHDGTSDDPGGQLLP